MKDWNITIRGVGAHRSGGDASLDIEALASDFIAKLVAAGHEVRIAEITPGPIDLTPKAED